MKRGICKLAKRGGVGRLHVEALEARLLLVVGPGSTNLPPTTLYPGVAGLVEVDILPVPDEPTYCTGTLLPSRRHLLTAAHCIPFGTIIDPLINYVQFPELPNRIPFTISTQFSDQNDVWIHPDWEGFGRDHKGSDIAIIDLDTTVSLPTYDIFRGSNEFTIGDNSSGITEFVGYGFTGRATPGNECREPGSGGLIGARRLGTNRFEALADELNGTSFNGDPLLPLFSVANFVEPVGSQLAFDFDNGLAAHDAMGSYLSRPDALGLGNQESHYGQGDSGGPNFLGGKIAGVTSYAINRGLNSDLRTDLCGGILSSVGEIGVSMRVSYYQNWIDSFFPPKVMGVTVAAVEPGSLSQHGDYSVPSGYDPVTGRALQLQTVPIAQANQIAFKFNKPVQETAANLIVDGINGITYVVSNRDYDEDTQTVTWNITPPLAHNGVPDQVEFILSGITDRMNPAIALDGDWDNPSDLFDTTVSSFPSGDWKESGSNEFVFRLNFVPGDFNLDNVIDTSDFGLWNSNKFTSTGANGFQQGDANGDNFVDGSDFGIWNTHKFTDWTTWRPEGGRMLAGGGGGSNGAMSTSGGGDWLAAYEALVERYRIFRDGSVNPELTEADWTRFADEVMALLGA